MEVEKLLNILEDNARISNKDIALMLNETEEAVANKIKELEDSKVIAGYHTVVNRNHGVKEEVSAVIEVNSTPERENGYDRVANMICKYPEVKSMYLISGRTEFLVLVTGETMNDIANFVGSKLAPMEGVKGTSTVFVLKNYKKDGIIFEEEQSKHQERLFVSV
jgi:Transcriptional regulators